MIVKGRLSFPLFDNRETISQHMDESLPINLKSY